MTDNQKDGWQLVSPIMAFENNQYIFKCAGCKCLHVVNVNKNTPVHWGFNGDVNKPTFTPSLLVNQSHPESRCHSFIRDGKIQYLNDCYHELKGQTVDIPPFED